ncbi:DUF3892 domain-containing protein [Sorangium sp. So ce131]|uniref:DUF3892 domain-containing protein n=1 Tax=Sorangium sp. So ce131 TaxID=3133282 RepID=UPI003F645912
MMKRVSCIRRTNRQSAHERIQGIGGVEPDGTPWYHPLAVAISNISSKRFSYYVERPGGHRVTLVIARSSAGHDYVKTEADGEQPNNLLALPDCP